MKSKIIDILRTFSSKDVKRFRDFLESPFFNESENLVKLYNSLLEFYPDFEDENLTEEFLNRNVYTGAKQNLLDQGKAS
jgi:hypothetical protein